MIVTGELFSSNLEYKHPINRELVAKYIPINIEARTEEFTELIAFTEADSSESSSSDIEDLHISQATMPNNPSTDPNSPSQPLGTIHEELELELEKAISDLNDPEVISVPHIEKGLRVKLKKDFKGARIVDLQDKVNETLEPVDDTFFDISKTIVDENDVRFATLTHKLGQKVRVKRNFKGARIVELEKRVNEPNAFLIGKSVENEHEFAFNCAYPDPHDPEVVVVVHKETGEGVKVRKSFQDSCVVDDGGIGLGKDKLVDRSDFEISMTVVDQDDVHLATLRHKLTQARVRVRRDFKGAKIVDLERKVDGLIYPNSNQNQNPNPNSSHQSEKSEPEPISADLSDLEFTPYYDLAFDMPTIPNSNSKSKPAPHTNLSPGRERLADLAKIISEESQNPQLHSPEAVIPRLQSYKNPDFLHQIQVPHYRDLDNEFLEFESQNDSLSESETFSPLTRISYAKPPKPKKFRPADAFKLKALEEIYLERQGGKAKPALNRKKFSEDILEPDMEIESIASDLQFNHWRGPALERAGEEIVRGRGRKV